MPAERQRSISPGLEPSVYLAIPHIAWHGTGMDKLEPGPQVTQLCLKCGDILSCILEPLTGQANGREGGWTTLTGQKQAVQHVRFCQRGWAGWPGNPGPPTPHLYRRALGQPGPPNPSPSSTGPGRAGPLDPFTFIAGPPQSFTFIDGAWPTQPLTSIVQTPRFYQPGQKA